MCGNNEGLLRGTRTTTDLRRSIQQLQQLFARISSGRGIDIEPEPPRKRVEARTGLDMRIR
jgi:hypothetical protein